MRLPRQLDAIEVRVLGCLLEKEQTTPNGYPLSVNSLTAACNQKSNRDPVMQLKEGEVRACLDRLHEDVLVWPVTGARVEKWRHSLDRRWDLEPETRAVMTVLMLRGPQTPGEIRGRSERIYPFRETEEVERTLRSLSEGDEPMVVRLGRAAGQKEDRWTHLLTGPPDPEELEKLIRDQPGPRASGPSTSERLAALEERVARLEKLLEGL